MALTNYGILTCRGTGAEVPEVGYRVTYDVTQGEVLDALKAGTLVVLIDTDTSLEAEVDTNFHIVSELVLTSNSNKCMVDEIEIGLNYPDRPLALVVQ